MDSSSSSTRVLIGYSKNLFVRKIIIASKQYLEIHKWNIFIIFFFLKMFVFVMIRACCWNLKTNDENTICPPTTWFHFEILIIDIAETGKLVFFFSIVASFQTRFFAYLFRNMNSKTHYYHQRFEQIFRIHFFFSRVLRKCFRNTFSCLLFQKHFRRLDNYNYFHICPQRSLSHTLSSYKISSVRHNL